MSHSGYRKESLMPEFAVNLAKDERHSTNGKLALRVVLKVDGQQRTVQRINLESDLIVTRTARKWSEQFNIDQEKVVSELQELSVLAMAQVVEYRQQRAAAPGAELRISELADEFLGKLKPEWHRKHRSVYFQSLGREVALGSLWTLGDDALVDRVVDTVEAREAARNGPPLNYRSRLGLLKEAIAMAGSRLLTQLPAVVNVADDATVDKDVLLDRLVQWFLRDRNFRSDTGNPISMTYHTWCAGLDPGDAWHQCFSSPVFARVDGSSGLMRVAVRGQKLAEELHYESSRKLAADLRYASFADTDGSIKVTPVTWRVWLFTPKVIDSITGGCAK